MSMQPSVVVEHTSPAWDFAQAMRTFAAAPHDLFGVRVWPGVAIPEVVAALVSILIGYAIILAFVSVAVIILVYLERKVAGHIQSRLGPMRVGWHGILQSIADGLKLFLKEDIVPAPAHKFLFSLAPCLVLLGAIVPFVAVPFADKLVVANMDAAVFFVLAFASIEVVGVVMAGWAPNSKWSLYGGMRLGAQMMSYEIPMSISAIVVVMLAGSLNFIDIAAQQKTLPWVIISPWAFLSFFIFYIAALASAKRAPFDLPEAESELVSGYHTEYSGMRFAFFFLAEYAVMILVSAVASILFLGGWHFPFDASGHPVLGACQLLAKTSVLLFVMLWLRWTLPRVRIDQVMFLCLKVLLPFSLACLLGATFEVLWANHLAMWLVFALLAGGTWLLGRGSQTCSAPPLANS
jgi:NADH-quinone oxidoreductase subunit H